MTDTPYAEAVEAARVEARDELECADKHGFCDMHGNRWHRDGRGCLISDAVAKRAVAAAVGPLLAPVRERMASHKRVFMSGHCECLACDLLRLCDAIEAGATGEGGQS